MATRDLRVDIIGTDRASGVLDRVAGAANNLGGRFRHLGGAAAAGMGGAIGGAAASGLAAVKNFAGGAVDAFAAVEDATGAAGVMFGKAMPQVTKFAEQAASSFGISNREALEAQNTFGTFGKAAGMTEGDLSGFSQKLTGLAGDLASFKGTSVEQAIGAIGSALKGEADPIEAFGVQMNAAAIQSEALSQGLIKTTKEALTPQQKTLAVTALLFKQTKDAQGDYARTSDGTANTQKTLAAEMENAQAALGQKLAPAMTVGRRVMLGMVKGAGQLLDKLAPLAGGVTQVVEALLTGEFKGGPLSEDSKIVDVVFRIREGIQTLIPKVQEFAREIALPALKTAISFMTGSAIPALVSFGGFISRNRDFMVPFVGTIVALVAAMKVYAVVQRTVTAVTAAYNAVLLMNPIGLVVVAIAALVAGLVIAYQRSETFRTVVQAVFKAVAFAVLTAVDIWLGALQKVFQVMGKIPGVGEKFRAVADAIGGARSKLDGLKDSLSGLKSKEITVTVREQYIRSAALRDSAVERRGIGVPGAARSARSIGGNTTVVNVGGKTVAKVVNQQNGARAARGARVVGVY